MIAVENMIKMETFGIILVKENIKKLILVTLVKRIHLGTMIWLRTAIQHLRETPSGRVHYGSVGVLLPNEGSRSPNVHGGVNGYLSVV